MKKSTLLRLLDSVVDGVVVADTEGVHRYVNRAFCDMVGLDADDLLGHGAPHPYWPPEHLPEIVEAFADTAAGTGHSFELTFRRSNEERFPVSVRPAAVDIDGERLVIATVMDLTEHYRRDAEVQQLRGLVDTMLDGADIAWWKWDVNTGASEVSSSYLTMLGYAPDAWMPTFETWAAHVHPDDIGDADEKMRALLDDKARIYDSEHRMRDASGEWRWILARGYVTQRNPDGSPAVVQGTHQDIQQRRRQEETLQQFYKMEIVGQMSGGIAHDFNNLLAIIEGNLSLLESDADTDLSPAARESLRDAASAIERGETMIKSLLQYAKSDGRQLKRFSLADGVEASWLLLRSALPQSVELSRDLPTEDLYVFGHSGFFESILLNLVLNARDALGDSRGDIRLRISPQSIRGEEANRLGIKVDHYAEIIVSDDGSGMSDDVRRRATEPLFTTKPLGKGTGLGLAMVKKFAQDAGGTVEIESQLGRGTAVKVLLPLDAPTIDTIDDGEQDGTPAREQRVLVVDDEVAIVKLLVAQLKRRGFDARGADNPRTALSLMLDAPPDLLVTDIVMPHTIDGLGLARRARAMMPGLRVAFITGFSRDIGNDTIEEIGPILSKPFSGQEFIDFIEETLAARGVSRGANGR